MKITRNENEGFMTFSPINDQDIAFLRAIRTAGGDSRKLKYCGRHGAGCRDSYNKRMVLSYEVFDGVLDSQIVMLKASNDESEKHVRTFRDAQFFGGIIPRIVGDDDAGGDAPAKICLKLCKHCQAPLVDMSRCEFNTCDACAEKCQHEPKKGYVHGGEAGLLSEGTYCGKCGRGIKVGENFSEHLKSGGILVAKVGGKFTPK